MTEFAEFDRIRMLWPDHFGLPRGKYVPPGLAPDGSAFCISTFGLTYDRDIVPVPGAYVLDGLKDMRGSIDTATLRPSWEDDRTGVAVTDLSLAGEPCALSARCALARAVADWKALGYTPKVGIELEGYLLEPDDDGGWKRFDNPRSVVYATGLIGDPSGFHDEVIWAADRCGFVLESTNVEFDESQFEFTLRFDDAMKAADDVFLFRIMVREIAIGRGLDFTFLGKPFPTVAGSGLHINFSFVDDNGDAVLYDETTEHRISALGSQCIAGLIEHHRGLAALCAPTVNAYRRLQPGLLSGMWANWGVDHRNVTNRIPAEGGASMRVESRIADGAVNVHTAVAAVLHAARLGVVNGLICPPPYAGDGFEEGGEGVDRCAQDLSAALDDLEADTELIEAVGELLVANFIGHKRNEAESFAASGETLDSDEITRFEIERYLPFH